MRPDMISCSIDTELRGDLRLSGDPRRETKDRKRARNQRAALSPPDPHDAPLHLTNVTRFACGRGGAAMVLALATKCKLRP
jgi:hypothetical protein